MFKNPSRKKTLLVFYSLWPTILQDLLFLFLRGMVSDIAGVATMLQNEKESIE
jgi:hypothetical protein